MIISLRNFHLKCDFLFAVPYNQLNITDYIAFFPLNPTIFFETNADFRESS